ncbi:MAG: Crp/Fnr family transcriptional regulator [Bryobacteraceae bacterium]|nr:Crp/Fnr family transcriptional regulator [Bryobacteraceae bacterium]MCX7603101.1 Crp/Fnr family transcriptional regulator [Bryobacteraceae bacterium]
MSVLRDDTFRCTPLFSTLPEPIREQLAQLAIEKRFGAGETIFYEGDPCDGLYVIGEGSVKISKTSPSGREIMLAMESAPSSVAEVPLFDEGAYPATVRTLTPVTAYLLRKEDFRRFCLQHPEVPLRVFAILGRRLRQLVSLIEAITFGSMRQRLARILLESSERGEMEESPLTHEELAMRLGTVREVVSRNLARFQAEGIVRMDRRRIVIADPEALRAEAETEF